MVYGAEAVLPIEMYEPTLRVMLYDEDANWEMMKFHLIWTSCQKFAAMLYFGNRFTKSE